MNDLMEIMDNSIKGNTILEVHRYRLTNPGTSIRQACDELGFDYRQVLRWTNEEEANAWVAEEIARISGLSQMLALAALPEVVTYMSQIATGKKQQLGANPVAAAKFISELAKQGLNQQVDLAKTQSTFIPRAVDIQVVK